LNFRLHAEVEGIGIAATKAAFTTEHVNGRATILVNIFRQMQHLNQIAEIKDIAVEVTGPAYPIVTSGAKWSI